MSKLMSRKVRIVLDVPMCQMDDGPWQVDCAWAVLGRQAEEKAQDAIEVQDAQVRQSGKQG